MITTDQLLLAWFGLANLLAFLLVGYDKLHSARAGSHVPEFNLALIGAMGGWPGGLLGMLLFRHKTAKLSFQIKYAVAFLVWAVLVCGYWRLRGH